MAVLSYSHGWIARPFLYLQEKHKAGGSPGLVANGERHGDQFSGGDFIKRYGDLFKNIVDIENIYVAYKNARRGKGWQNTVKRFEENLDKNLIAIQKSLIDHTFTTATYRSKTIYEPKQREIYILPFAPDRIVQHALMNIVEPIWESLFIDTSFACRKGKGLHAGSLKTMEYVRRNKYCLKCDISKFYPSVRHDILSGLVRRKIKCPETLWLLDDIINSFPGETNVPIGNYTSQWFGNLYLNELDMFVKHNLKCRDYLRYCDDFCLFSDDKGYLNDCARSMEEFLWDKLKLTYSKCRLFPVSLGVDFLGYRHFPEYILLRKSTAKRVKKRLKTLPKLLRSGRITIEQFRSSIASTMGWLKWAKTKNFQMAIELEKLWEVANGTVS